MDNNKNHEEFMSPWKLGLIKTPQTPPQKPKTESDQKRFQQNISNILL